MSYKEHIKGTDVINPFSNIGIGESPMTNVDLLAGNNGVVAFKETTLTPTAVSGYGKLYTKSDNALYFQDGDGTTHNVPFGIGIDDSSWIGNNWNSTSSGISSDKLEDALEIVAVRYDDRASQLKSSDQGNPVVANYVGDGGNDSNTLLLLHADSDYTDTSIGATVTHTPTTTDMSISTVTKKIGSGSFNFNGSTSSLSYNGNTDFNPGSGNFTIDFYALFNTHWDHEPLFALIEDSSNYYELRFNNSARSQLNFIVVIGGTTIVNINGTHGMSDSTWYHIAVIRGWGGSNSSWVITVNGSVIASTTTSNSISTIDGNLQLGSDIGTNGRYLDGYIDEFRYSNIARWTSSFTPNTIAYSKSLNYFGFGNINIDYFPESGNWDLTDDLSIRDSASYSILHIDKTNKCVGIDTNTPSAHAGLTLETGVLCFKETTTPTADDDYGKIYTKTDNQFYFQSGANIEYEVMLADQFSMDRLNDIRLETDNMCIGEDSGHSLDSGAQYNLAIGETSLYSLENGTNNIAIGQESLYNNDGNYNLGIGYQSGYNITTGTNNLCIGNNAGDIITTGSYNICIGHNTDVSSNSTTYQLNIGDLLYGDLLNNRIGINTNDMDSYNSNAKNLIIKNNSDCGISIVSTSSTTGNLFFADGTTSSESKAGYVTYDHSNNSMVFGTNNIDRVTISAVGSLGIGNMSPSYMLDVKTSDVGVAKFTSTDNSSSIGPSIILHRDSDSPSNNDNISAILMYGNNDAAESVQYAYVKTEIKDIANGSEDGQLDFGIIKAGASSTMMSIVHDGTISIGEHFTIGDTILDGYDSDAGNLIVKDASNSGITIASGAITSKTRINFADGTTSPATHEGSIVYDHSTNGMTISTNHSDAITIDSSGHVGVGTDSPADMLHVKADSPSLWLESISSTSALAPHFNLYRNSPDPEINDYIGDIIFLGKNTATTPGIMRYAKIMAQIKSVTSGSESGRLIFNTLQNGSEVSSMVITENGKIGIGTISPSVTADLTLENGTLCIKETTTPTADTNYGKIYTKSDNTLYFQDGAGTEHLLNDRLHTDTTYYIGTSGKPTKYIDSAAAVDKGSGNVGIPCTGHSFSSGDNILIDDTTNYDGSYSVVSVTTNEIVITATYVAETFSGTEQVFYKQSTTWANIYNATAAVIPKNLNGYTATIQFHDGYYDITSPTSSGINIGGHYRNGTISVVGNSSYNSLSTKKGIWINNNTAGYVFYFNDNERSNIQYLRIKGKKQTSAVSSIIQFYSCSGKLQYCSHCYIEGDSTSTTYTIYGAAASYCPNVGIANTKFSNVGTGILSNYNSKVYSNSTNYGAIQPSYGLQAIYNGVIGKLTSTNITGSIANETTTGGGVIR